MLRDLILVPALLGVVVAAPNQHRAHVTRSGSQLSLQGRPWTASGANVYWLGIDENVVPPPGSPYADPASYPTKGRIVEIMDTLVAMGAHTIRSQTLGVSVGHPLSLEPELGVFNEEAFESIDWAVHQASLRGLRISAPLVDNYDYYHGGKFSFLRFRGINISSTESPVDPSVQQFYNNREIVNDFKQYIHKLLTHTNQYNGLTYAEDPTIYAYETGNELGGPVFGDMDVPRSWTDEICSYVKEIAPRKLCVDGTYGINKTHLDIASVDIVSDHFYPLDLEKLETGIQLASNASKAYMVGEYDWTGNIASAPSLSSFFDIIESRKEVVAGDQFWSLFMHDVPDCAKYVDHEDGFTMHYGDPRNSAQNNTQISLVRQHFFRMQGKKVGKELPPVKCKLSYY